MPTYDFACKECGHAFSVTTSWSRKKDTRCPKCNSGELKEQFGNYRLSTVGGAATGGGNSCGPVG